MHPLIVVYPLYSLFKDSTSDINSDQTSDRYAYYKPGKHRLLIRLIEAIPSVRYPQDNEAFNAILEQIGEFRKVHLG